jgi:hypothetical protein
MILWYEMRGLRSDFLHIGKFRPQATLLRPQAYAVATSLLTLR